MDARVPRGGAGRRDAARDPRPGAGRARHRHRRRDAPRELLEPLRHRARRGRHRQPGDGAGPQRPPEPGPAGRGPDPPHRGRCSVRDVEFLRANTDRPDQDHRAGPVHDVPAGPERLLRERRASSRWPTRPRSTRRSRTSSPPAPTSCSSTSPTCRRGPRRRREYGARGARARARRASTGTTAVHICFGYAAIIHERPPGYSFLPELAACPCDQISIETAQSGLDLSVLDDAAGQDDHPRRPRPRRPGGRDARDRGGAHPPRAAAQVPRAS